MTNNNTADPEPPEGGESGEEEQPEGSDGAVTVKIVQNLMSEESWFSSIKTQEPADQPAGNWDATNKTLTWENVEIAAGQTWTRTVTVLIDTSNLDSIEDLPTDLTSSVLVYDATAGEPGDEQQPIITEPAEPPIDLKTFVGSAVKPVEGETKTLPQNVHWRDNNDLSERPTSPQEFAGGVCLQFYIGDEAPEGDSGWTDLTTETMGQLGLTAETLPQVTTNSAYENALWELTAQVPAKIQYGSGTMEALQAEVNWRIVPPETPSAYYFHTIEGSSDWYYLKKQEVTFNIDFRDAVYDEKITADQVEDFLRENFTLCHEAGADAAASVNWKDVDLVVEGSNGNFTLKLENAVYYTINNEVVHYYLLANNETEGTIPIDGNWPGKDQGDSYKIEYDNHDNPNVGTVTDKVYSGGTLVLTREGTVEYNATKIWITPENRKESRPDGYFELYRYTYPGGSYQTAAPVHGVETVPFADVGNDGKVVFKSTDGSELELPKYDPEGNRYVYVMKEVLTDTGEDKDSYEQIFGKVGSDGEVAADSDQGPPEDVREGNWERESNDNYVYNNGTITNRIDEQKTVSVTKEWDASSFQAGLGNVEVEMTLYERVKGSTDKWVKSNPERIVKMDEFSAVNASMSGSTTVPTYNALGQEMEYRFFETKITQGDKVYDVAPTTEELQSGTIEDKKFELTYNGNTVEFISKQPVDEEIGGGKATIVNSIQDEITYTIDKIWVDPLEPKEVSFALYQQGQGQVNTYVGTVTLVNEVDTAEQSVGTLTVGEGENQKTYNVTYKVTETGFTQLVIEGLPRYDEHGYSYEYIIVEMPGEGFAADYETTIDESGNYTTVVTNAPGEGHRILVRKRWIDNSDVQHREPVEISVYYQKGDTKNLESDYLGSVILGGTDENGNTKPWYDYFGFGDDKLDLAPGEEYEVSKVYIRETKMGTHEVVLSNAREDGSFVDRVEADNHTYEVTYVNNTTIEVDDGGEGANLPEGYKSDPLFIATNRRLGNIDITVTKEWKDGGALREALQKADIVPVVKLVVDTDKTSAVPPGEDQKIEDIINYKDNTITLTNEPVPIQGQAPGSKAGAIQPLIVGDEPVEELYFFNLPKYDKDGRVANYTVEELWWKDENADGEIDKTECIEQIKESNPDLAELLEDLTVTVTQESYTENDGNHINDDQQITITNKLGGTKSIEFHKQWNDTYAFDSGKRPDLYLTLYQLTGDNLITEYREYHWDKSLQTEEGEGGQQGQGEETEEPPQEGGTETQAQDNYYWTCIFENLPKYDEDGNEIFYYAVENLAVNDPSTFHYAYPVFEYGEKTFDSVYGEGGKPSLPSKEDNKDDETGQEILKEVKDDKVALLEGGTFLNNLEEDVTINGVKLWANLPLTASEADLPSVTFNVYQFSSDVTDTSDSSKRTLVAKLEVTSEMWKNSSQDGSITANGNQYTFTIDEVTVDVEGLNKGDPLPLYDAKGNRYTYKLVENLGKEGEDQNVDWTLVYHNETFNEYQITNTYDPQLGALSVKKLLEIPTVDDQQYYPAVTMDLYRALPDENGNYSLEHAELLPDQQKVWSSTNVKNDVENLPAILIEPKPPVIVSHVFTFEDLPMYAPNGQEYRYFVVELIEGRMYYESAVVMDDIDLPVYEDKESVEETFDSIFTEGSSSNGQNLPTEVIPLTPNKKMEDGSSETAENVQVSATFGDRYIKGDAITLQLTKIWEDQNNALELRPDTTEFANSLKLYRSAPAQGGDGGAGAIGEQEIFKETYEISVAPEEGNSNRWTITITSKNTGEFAQYAPNGMPWIYKVTEENTGKDWAVYITTPDSKQVWKSADEAQGGTLNLGELKNSLMTSHTFTKNWANAGDDNLTWENIGVEKMDITGTLYVGVMENGTLTGTMTNASDFFEGSQWEAWFKDLGGLGEEEENYKFEKSQTIDVGTEGEIVFDNLPLVQKNNEDGTTSQLVYVVAETKIAFTVNEKNYTQSFIPTFTADGGNLTITYKTEGLMVGNEGEGEAFFTPQSQSIPLSSLANKTATESSATNAIGTMELTIKKIWNDNNDAEKLRPKSVDLVILKEAKDEQEEVARADLFASREIRTDLDNVVLKANREPYTVNISGNNSVTIPDLPSVGFDEQGNLITYQYTVRELRPGWQDDDILNEDDILKAGDKYNPYYTVSYDDNAHTVTNTLTHMDITAVKAWKPEGLHGDYAEVTFTLQSRVVGSGDDAWKDVADADGKPVSKKLTGEEDPAWTVTWTELPRTENGQTLEYCVVEKLADGLKEEEHVQFSITPETISSESADKTFTFTVTNIPLGQITVTKKGEDGGLPNVEFTLTGSNGESYEQTTSADGTAIFTGFPLYDSNGTEITYTLEETSTPDGYIQLTELIKVTFTAADQPNGGIYWETTDGKYLLHKVEYEVVNGQYFPVVHTGGSGFYWPGVLGAGAAAAGVLYLIRRKTKGHNTER